MPSLYETLTEYGADAYGAMTGTGEEIETKRVAFKDQQVDEEFKLKYGDTDLTEEELNTTPKLMYDRNLKWNDLSPEQQTKLGGYKRFSALTLEQMRSNGGTKEEKDIMLNVLGLPPVQAATQPSRRFGYGLASTIAEMGSAVGLVEDDTSEKRYQDKVVTSRMYNAYEDTDFDILTGVGEGTPSMALGAVAPVTKTGLIADMAGQTILSALEYVGAKDFDPNAGQQASIEGALNLGTYGLASGLLKQYKGVEPEAVKQLATDVETLANEWGIKLFSVDEAGETGITSMRSRIANLNDKSKLNLAKSTAPDMVKFLDNLETTMDNINTKTGDSAFVATQVLRDFEDRDELYGASIKEAYKEVKHAADGVKNIQIDKKAIFETLYDSIKDVRVDARKEVRDFLKELEGEYPDVLNPSQLTELEQMLGSKGRDAGKQLGGGTSMMGYNKAQDATRGITDGIIDGMRTQANEGLPLKVDYDLLNYSNKKHAANKLYLERLKKYGYRDTGKDADGIIPKFYKALETNPENAFNTIKTAKDWNEIVPELSEDTVALMQKHKLAEYLKRSTNAEGKISLTKFNNLIESTHDELGVAMYGVEKWNNVKTIGKVGQYLGSRAHLVPGADKSITAWARDNLMSGSVGAWLPAKIAWRTLSVLFSPNELKLLTENAPKDIQGPMRQMLDLSENVPQINTGPSL